MTSLIKRDAAPDVRAIRAFAVGGNPPAEPKVSAAEREIILLRQQIDELESKHADALAKARADGKREAESAIKRDEAEALALLQQGLERSAKQFRERLASLESLALLLSDAALSKVFGDAAAYRELTARAVAAQLRGIEKESVLRIVVSAQDFRDEHALRALTQRLASRCEIVRDAHVRQGDCRIELRLGQIELSICDHWAALQARLRQLAGAAP